MRLNNIDFFKGLLIILVILGHILQGSLEESIFRYTIYSFHMPLFIGISGFLFNANKVVDFNFIALIKRYLYRIIIPWTLAIAVYFLLSSIESRSVTITGIVKAFAFPYYHLWFIPGFLCDFL